jgi:hypothetical protein
VGSLDGMMRRQHSEPACGDQLFTVRRPLEPSDCDGGGGNRPDHDDDEVLGGISGARIPKAVMFACKM